jgi:hypothetical protein
MPFALFYVPVPTPFCSYSLHDPLSLLLFFSNKPTTTSTTLLNPSISSSTVPPSPALEKLIEFPTYTGLLSFLARTLDNRVVKSRVPL